MAAALFVNVRKPKEFKRTGHVFELEDGEMFQRYRFTNNGVDYLCDLLHNQLVHDTKRSFALTPRQQLLLTLRYFATGAMMQVVGDTFGVDKSTVSRVVDRVTTALLGHLNEFICWPNQAESQDIMANFYLIAGFPNVVGCIDGTHVRIQSPPQDEASFVNRKGFHSIAVQAVCDDKGKIDVSTFISALLPQVVYFTAKHGNVTSTSCQILCKLWAER